MNCSLLSFPASSSLASRFATLVALFLMGLAFTTPAAAQVNFNASGVSNVSLDNPTSLQFGPDGRLYVSQQDGLLKALTVQRNEANDYEATSTEAITLVQNIPNHDDDGTSSSRSGRQVTGLYVAGTAANPVLYVSSSDPRIGAGNGGDDLGLDTNSGIISKLTCPGGVSGSECQGGWEKVDLVRGLPRSEENHATNGLQFDAEAGVLLVAQGGHTNAGSPAHNFAFTNEYALSAAILEIDLTEIEGMPTKTDGEGQDYKYDLPTLDDPSRTNESDGSDLGDPFGGNNGLNMAELVENGPVQIYSPGYRNPYDLVLTEGGKLYVVDNGANGDWGGYPQYEESEACTNQYLSGEPGSTGPGPDPSGYPSDVTLLPGSDGQPDPAVNNHDNLHYVPSKGFYAGHPNPIRANPVDAGLYIREGSGDDSGVFRDGSDPNNPLPADWPAVPVSMADPTQCDYRQAGVDDGALHTWDHSTNGLTEYTASNFDGALQGDLLAAEYQNDIFRVELNAAGDGVTNVSSFASSFGSQPLDVIAQGDDDAFGGTVWAATYGASDITVFEPSDYDGGGGGSCSGDDDDTIDEDGDGYSNADEIDNGTDPCSGASKPSDFDGTLAADGFKDSDLNDPDDDDDGLLDTEDAFAIDADNGTATSLPIEYSFFNNDPGFGFGNIGFTGLQSNGTDDYLDLKDPSNDLILGGTSGLFTDPSVGPGDSFNQNDQVNAFQFGVNVDQGTGPFTVEVQMNGDFLGDPAEDYQAQGFYVGTGDQTNYLKLVVNANGGSGGFEVLYEENEGTKAPGSQQYPNPGALLGANTVKLYLSIDPAAGTVQPKYSMDGGAVTDLGTPVQLSSDLLDAVQGNYELDGTPSGLAVGLVATSYDASSEFAATWQHLNITKDPVTAEGSWTKISDFDETRHENAFVQAGDKFYLLGGRESNTVRIYDPATETWTDGADAPMQLHHFQAVEKDGLIYAVGALTGGYPGEDPVENVYIYDPAADQWITGPQMPAGRLRGSGGTAVYDGKIYFAGGNVNGHNGPASTDFDVLDPATGTWTTLPDMPRPRDHFFATVTGGKLYAIGGRVSDKASGDGDVFDDTIAEVDVYDFDAGSWSTLPASANLPTPRAAPPTALLNGEIVVAGGESSQPDAHEEVEAFNPDTQTWRTLTPMRTPRHATQAVVSNGGFYVAAGSGSQGGASQPQPLDGFYFFGETSPDGTPIAASTLSAPGTLDFGAVAPGASTDETVTLDNTGGDQALVVESATLSGSSDFTLDDPLDEPVVIAPGASRDLTLTFAPADEGAETGTLTVTHGGGQTLDVALEGMGGAAAAIVERINAGGSSVSADDDGPDWSQGGPYVTGGQTYTNDDLTAGDIDASAAEAGPAGLYLTEHSGEAPFFTYDIPVPEDGSYTVKLHFAEIYFGAEGGDTDGGTGDRVFSVDIEDGQDGLSGYDIFADVGAQTAVVKTFNDISVSDGQLTLDFSASTNQPKVSAIEVLGSGDNEPPTVEPIADQTNAEGDDISNAGLAVTASDPDNGPENLIYSISGQPAGVDIEPTNGQIIGAIADSAAADSPYDVTVTVSDGADQVQTGFTWTVTDEPGGAQTVIARVNAGGDGYTDTSGDAWEADSENSYFDGGQSFVAGDAGTNPNMEIAGTDDDVLYRSERSSGESPTTFSYDIPVPQAGTYTVNLRFAEIYWGAPGGGDGGTGQRVFSANLEGGSPPELAGYDINADVGPTTAVTKSYTVEVTDDTLNIDFFLSENGVNQPKVSAIEVLGSGDNEAPAITAIDDQTSTEGESVSLQVDATDPDEGDVLTYSATDLPPNLSIDAGTGLIAGTIASGGQGSAFQEENGLAVMEMESGDAPAAWAEETSRSDYTGDGYLRYDGSDHFSDPGVDVIEYQVEITNPGTYRFQWRNQAGGNDNTEENDSWLKILADSFYGEDGSGDIVCPKGYDASQNDCTGSQPNGAGSEGWFKVYANSTNWGWQTSTSDNEPHDIFAEFSEAGTYTIQVSARSVGHVIDRAVLYRVGPGSPAPSNPTDTQLAESPQGGSGASEGSPYAVEVTVADENGGSATENFQWIVDPAGPSNDAPTLAAIGDQSVEESQTLDVSVSATDPNDDPITLSTSDVPGFASFTDDGDGTGTLALAPQTGDAGSYDVTVTASDGNGGTASETFTLTVTPAGAQTVVARLNAGGATDPITDDQGRTWTPDDYFGGTHGKTYSNPAVDAGDINTSAAGTTDPEIYTTERSSDEDLTGFNYSIPVPETGTYTVNLHFAEIYFGTDGGNNCEDQSGGDDPLCAGDRVFSVNLEGGSPPELDSYDLVGEVGSLTATVKTYSVEVTDGTLDLDFTASENRPKVSAIEVLGAPAGGDATIAGTVSYGGDTGNALEGATLTLSGDASATASTGPDGNYSLTAATGQSYALSASKSSDPQGASAGLTTTDLSLIKLHILNTQLLEDSLRILAADVNGNASVDGGDVALGRQVILGRSDFGENDAFVCTVAEGAFPNEEDPFDYVASYSYDPLSGERSGQDFRCAKRGDADASRGDSGGAGPALTASASASARSASSSSRAPAASSGGGAPLRLALGKAQAVEASASASKASQASVSSSRAASVAEQSEAREFLVPVTVPAGHAHLGGYQFTLEWDAERLAFAGVEDLALPGMSQANFNTERARKEGLLSTVWVDPRGRGQDVEAGARLFKVRFRVKERLRPSGSGDLSVRVRFTSSLTKVFAHDGETFQALRVETEDGSVKLEALPNQFALVGNYPNPVRSQTNVAMDLPARAEVTVGVYDALGRQVKSQSKSFSAGKGQSMRLQTGALSSGVYVYRVTAHFEGGETRAETGRFVLVR